MVFKDNSKFKVLQDFSKEDNSWLTSNIKYCKQCHIPILHKWNSSVSMNLKNTKECRDLLRHYVFQYSLCLMPHILFEYNNMLLDAMIIF